ncbi:MAG: hypothetical protein JXA66_04365 [Oligoflexia bacterium]|nr:hypothetical protein [Oligoflexia bacterium]
MLTKLLELLGSKADLIELSKENALSMLNTSHEMFNLVVQALGQKADHSIKEGISRIDRRINEKQKEVRKMVFEHLAISGVKDLLTSVQLFAMVTDIERIGDYVKNLAEVVDYIPDGIKIEEYRSKFDEIVNQTKTMFERTLDTVKNFNDAEASEVIVKYENVARDCEIVISDIIKAPGDTVKKSNVRLLLLVRYIKRINAHLKNVAAAIKNPVHNIGHFNTDE